MDHVVAVSKEQYNWMCEEISAQKRNYRYCEPCVDLMQFLDVKARKTSNKIKKSGSLVDWIIKKASISWFRRLRKPKEKISSCTFTEAVRSKTF